MVKNVKENGFLGINVNELNERITFGVVVKIL